MELGGKKDGASTIHDESNILLSQRDGKKHYLSCYIKRMKREVV